MSWLNKFLKIFKDKEDLYVEEHSIMENNYDNKIDNRGKEIETRVTYQYPKGYARPPLLPIEEKQSTPTNRVRTKRERKMEASLESEETRQELKTNRKKRQQQKSIPVQKQDRHQPMEIEKNEPYQNQQEQMNTIRQRYEQDQLDVNSTKPKEQSIEIRTKVSKKSSRPFRPTEIPSPIYGFTKRPLQSSIVEFELPSEEILLGMNNKPVKSPYFGEVVVDSFSEELETVQLAEKYEDIPTEETVSIYEKAKDIPTEETVSIYEKVEDIPNEESVSIYEKVEDIPNEESVSIYEKVEGIPTEETVNIYEKVEDIPNEENVSIYKKVEGIPAGAEVSTYEKVEDFPTSEEILLDENPSDVLLDEEILYKSVEDNITEIEEDIPTENEIVFVNENEQGFPNERGEVQLNEDKEKKSSQRSHLPFNVLMLKQDKVKWEEKRRLQDVRQESIVEKQEMTAAFKPSAIIQEKANLLEEADSTLSSPTTSQYCFPTMDLLNPPMTRFAQENIEWMENQEYLLNEALKNFGVRASVVNITQGPSVTRFEVQPEPGVKVNKITNLSDDIKLSLAAKDIRIEAPIPGKHTIGIEVPNKKSRPVLISEIIKSEAFQNSSSPLTAVLGLDISGAPVVTDLKKMPHGLIAGATGSGKSVCINSILISLLYKATPQELKLLLIDPKMVELAPYNHIPHLVSPVITDVKAATAALKWAVDEMERRYELFAHTGVRDINRFNELADQHKRYADKLPFIVIIIDELADLMMMSPADVEESICRIAQKARACGIHLIIATQRPSVDVITGLIKANVPTRTAFSVSSQIDSRTIIDISGAEKLLGRGDMLFLENGSSKPVRLQGTFVSDAEIDLVVEYVREQQEPEYLFHQEELLKKAQVIEDEDELFYEACEFVIEQGGASTSSVQRRFKIGYNRAARLIDMMEQQGFISEPKGSKPRDVLITEEELGQIQENTSSTFI